jgi:hypothetical protein
MSASETHQKLGNPAEKRGEREVFQLSDKNSAQVYYDKSMNVFAISINYMGAKDAPTAKQVIGSDVEPKPDGSIYMRVRYPKASCWVSYSRTAGDDPLVTVTMQIVRPSQPQP